MGGSLIPKRLADETERLANEGPERKPDESTARILVGKATAYLTKLLRLLAKNPELRYEMDDRVFEELVADLFERSGFDVELTPKSKDGGRDIIAIKSGYTGRVKTFVECKRYAEHRKVGVEIVRAVHGVVQAKDGSTNGLIVSTTRFTKPALQFVTDNTDRIAVTDGEKLAAWIRDTERLRAGMA